ncbi:Homeodomain-like protein [Akanthomyces lecanii RCEF 1005]|uniref:Homeodomain-like protein n=1 Tax=Akanthomyces lecanii RCEF 1005 TaxID=1081108 RepID=A0A168KBC8_CORDF|nr:Homeodomain-like protein [Akanthomyces lecanii RCEF 1005]
MDPEDSDYQSNASNSNEDNSELEYSDDEKSGTSVILGEDVQDGNQVSDSSAGDQSPRKRSAENEPPPRPFKRQRSHLNPDYLDLLNRDIEDAAHRVCLEDDIDLPDSQLGLTYWSPLEKKQFFEALSRLGKHDLPGITQRIGTKSTIEVKHYLRVLHEAVIARRVQERRSYLEPAEYPAAIELTPQCCHAQEEAADTISIRQETREIQREERKWQAYWDITPRIAAELEKKQQQQQQQDDGAANLAFAKLFHVPRWLKLSDRMFMNSSMPGSNWRNIEARPPSMWATTLDDFHSLALSVTRRLVQTTLFISMSRIRAKSELRPETKNIVRKRDVEAAVASLGLSHNANDLWRKSARRLRLNVYENPPTRGDEEEEEEEPMTYEEVEAELSNEEPARAKSEDSGVERVKLEARSTDEVDDSAVDDDSDSPGKPKDEEERAVNREINEVLWYSAAGIRDLQSTRRALKLRIEMERRQERHADAVDEYASYTAETNMWELLQKAPPAQRPRTVPNPARMALQRSNLDVESLYAMNRTWADDLEYQAEWETLHRPVEPVNHDTEDDN